MAATACVITGIPIDYNCDIVAIKVEPYRYKKESALKYVPASFPYFGKYDCSHCSIYGDESIDVWNSFFIHRQVWDSAEMYFHSLNRQKLLNVNVKKILRKIKEEHEYNKLIPDRPKFSDITYAYGALRDQLTYSNITDYGLCLRNLFSSEGDLDNVANVPEGYSFLKYNKFAEIICEKIVKGEWTNEDDVILMKIISLFNASMILGKILQPAGEIRIEQCPVYKQRKKLHTLHGKILKTIAQKSKS